ncbi:distal tail protein Dit, partial [Lacticaseibacillus sp. 866-1]|uniref:distal tail protein Dit n=1 Tax=Lacticaseibacillus sp. 866-1 TaxID=2799576 RepID=UPI0019455BB5
MAGISLNYNGVELSQWFDVTDVQRNIGTSHVNSMTKVGRTDGQIWQYMSRDTKTIVVTGIVTNANLANLRRDLGAALDVDEPKQLIVGDDIGVYYLAIYDGQPTIAEDWRSGTISLTFIVPDGIAHSLSLKTVSGQSGTDITVNNVGTAPT